MLGLVQNSPTHLIAGNIYESLLRYDEKLQPQPSLAKSWEISSDAKVYTFKLQEGVKWHDGKPFTADDVVFSLDRFLRDVHPRWRTIVTQVEKIEKVDNGTIRIVLKQPFGPMILAMEVASAPMVPKHIYDGTDYRANPANNTPIATGPFKLKEWKKGSYIHLVRNDDYWMKGKPHLDEIYWHVIPDAAARAVAYETGRIDVLPGGSVDAYDVARLAKLPNTCTTTKGWEMFAPHAWLTPNIARGGALANKQFRQGMMYAIDREFGKNVVWSGLGKIPTGPISSKTKFYSPDVRKYTYDPAKAKALIKASGYKGELIKLLALPYGETWSRWAEAIKQNLIEAGVNVQTETTDVPGWTQKASNGEFDMTMTFLYQLGDPATGVARSYISTNIVKGNPFANQGAYMNPEVDRLFAQGASAPSDALRQEAYTKVQQLLAEEVPVLWLLELEFSTIYRCNVKNLVTTAIGVNDGFRDAWKE
jgi:peptide/nickel transport system substrate-binding protein